MKSVEGNDKVEQIEERENDKTDFERLESEWRQTEVEGVEGSG